MGINGEAKQAWTKWSSKDREGQQQVFARMVVGLIKEVRVGRARRCLALS